MAQLAPIEARLLPADRRLRAFRFLYFRAFGGHTQGASSQFSVLGSKFSVETQSQQTGNRELLVSADL